MKQLLLSAAIITAPFILYSQTNGNAKQMASRLSLDEKVNLEVGMGMKLPGVTQTGGTGVGITMDKVPGAAGTTYSISKIGIPTTVVADGPAGLRISPTREGDSKTYYATAWPVATLLASTWNTKLVNEVGKAFGNEVKEYGVDVILGPGMNIHRNPLGGRNFEYYSEDPLISGKIAAAMVKGIQSNGVGTSVKHFAANNGEKNRNTVDVVISERALREIYLKGFQVVVKEAKPWTIMSSYNKINGTYTSESYDLLTTILRKEWGFKGMVMTDWFGGKDAVAQMKAGNDLLMPGRDEQKKAITDALKNGTLDVKVLDQNAERIINYILATPSYKKYNYSNKPDLKAHAALARTAAAEGMVLLKNDNNTLPFSSSVKKVAAYGITSYDFVSGGTGSGDVNEEYTISLAQGLTNAGYQLDKELNGQYEEHVRTEKAKQPKKTFFEEFMNPTPRIPELALSGDLLHNKAAATDLALITIGRNAGEGSDRKVEDDFNLKETEQALVDAVCKAYHAAGKKVVVIINAGGVIETASWRDKVDAILLAWQPGLEAGNAVADILSGRENPSGRLATTFPLKYDDDITAKNFPGIEFKDKMVPGMMGMQQPLAEVTYEEGIYVGYRYYNTFHIKTAYEFGYGLSYTNFKIADINTSSKILNKNITITVTVTNTGKAAGKDVVQLYISAPKGKLDKPEAELKAFAKTKLLQPGQQEKVTFTISPNDLASFDTERTAWVAAAGEYKIKIGASSTDIKQTAAFTLAKEMVTEKCNSVLSPKVKISELHP